MKCRLCQKENLIPYINFGKMPIVKNLKNTIQTVEEGYPFKLVLCGNCDFVQIEEPISPEILYKNYINLSKAKWQPHVDRVIDVLEQIFQAKKNSRILDIGCNDGSFLLKLRIKGFSELNGIEPAQDAYDEAIQQNLSVHNSFFNYNTAQTLYEQNSFDIVIARQVIEHVADLNDFLAGISYVLTEDGVLCLELPDFLWNLEYLDYALWEEHVNYFTLTTLKNLLKLNDFDIFHSETTLFSGRALIVFCKKFKFEQKKLKKSNGSDLSIYKKSFKGFKSALHNFLKNQQKEIYIYGCGTRSSNFVNFLNIGEYIAGFIDDHISKQNKYVPKCNLLIEPWKNHKHSDSVYLLGCNTESENKVCAKHNLPKKAVFSICPPSMKIPHFWVQLQNV